MIKPSREQWWWRTSHLKRALEASPTLDHFFYWKVKGRKSPDGATWTREQRLAIETSLWLYELDARISHRYFFGKPAHLLSPEDTGSIVAFARPVSAPLPTLAHARRRRSFAWEWIEFFDKRDDKHAPELTRAELDAIIAAMKYCVEYFLHG